LNAPTLRKGRSPSTASSADELLQRLRRLAPETRHRLLAIRFAALEACPSMYAHFLDQTLVLQLDEARVRVRCAERHLRVHFPQSDVLAGIRARHPELSCGRSSVQIRDTQYLPIYELREAFRALVAAHDERAKSEASGIDPAAKLSAEAVKYRHG